MSVFTRARNALSGVITLSLTGYAALKNPSNRDPYPDRLQFFPTDHLPLAGKLSVRWDQHMVPMIEATHDEDIPFALGLVHAHLRIGQLVMMKHISQGRISELAGPLTVKIDHALRILNLAHSVSDTIAAMPQATRIWAERFLLGLNTYIERNASRVPTDLRVLGVSRLTPWTLRDLVIVWRLASADVNWGIYLRILQMDDTAARNTIWQALLDVGTESVPSVSGDNIELGTFFFNAAKPGSNSIAVGKSKTTTGAGFIANDPHLGLTIPNTWLLAGFKSPSYQVVGMMIPSMPFVALGRNPSIAWGGTNMWGISTYLYTLSNDDLNQCTTTEEVIKVRGWLNSTVKVRFSKLGPVISDMPFLKDKISPIAMKWVGHEVSDELTAFLSANRAQSFEDFRLSFQSYGVSAQNLLVVDHAGNIGHILAYRQPIRPDSRITALIQPASNVWHTTKNSTELPYAYNPEQGFIASANNQPFATDRMGDLPAIGWFYQSSDRVNRLNALLSRHDVIDLATLKTIQLDTHSITSLRIRDMLVSRSTGFSEHVKGSALWGELSAWDGFYHVDARGPVAFETLMSALAPLVFATLFHDSKSAAKTMLGLAGWKAFFLTVAAGIDDQALADAVDTSFATATRKFAQFQSWQDMHRIRVASPLSMLPLIGARFRFDEFGVGGGSDTVMKTATAMTGEQASAFYGTNARHISDMSDLDENYFVLFGGQDGWLHSAHATDQVRLWRDGQYIRLPLSAAGIADTFTRLLTLTQP